MRYVITSIKHKHALSTCMVCYTQQKQLLYLLTILEYSGLQRCDAESVDVCLPTFQRNVLSLITIVKWIEKNACLGLFDSALRSKRRESLMTPL